MSTSTFSIIGYLSRTHDEPDRSPIGHLCHTHIQLGQRMAIHAYTAGNVTAIKFKTTTLKRAAIVHWSIYRSPLGRTLEAC